MRAALALAPLLLLTACFMGTPTPVAVDAHTLPPLSGKEQALMVTADNNVSQGNYAAAENDYLSAISASTGHVDAHTALAKLYVKTNQPEKERAILDKGLVLQPNNPGLNYLLGKLDLAAHNNDAALEDFNRGLVTVPGDFDLTNGTAIANDMLGRHKTAQSIYLQLIREHKHENLAGVKTNLGMSYLFSGDPKKATAVLKPEAAKTGASPVTRYNLALAYTLQHDEMNAKFVLRGEDDSEARHETVKRLKAYIDDASIDKQPTNIKPVLAPQP